MQCTWLMLRPLSTFSKETEQPDEAGIVIQPHSSGPGTEAQRRATAPVTEGGGGTVGIGPIGPPPH